MNGYSVRKLSAVALGLAITCVCAFPASAGDRASCSRETTNSQDVEGGGLLTAVSHKTSAAKRFELMDVNRDGRVTAAEISGSRGAESIVWASELTSAADKLSQLDTNKDGALTVQEYADSSQKMFNQLDVDRNGVLSEAEMLMTYKGSSR